jgi:anti-sigma regulatory factor (Ser/Thr protein kinase)
MSLTSTGEVSVACRLGREPAHASRAREQARQALSGWGLGQHTDLAELVVSELVTNALRHGAGLIEMRLSYADGDLRVEIHDSGVGRPVRQHVAADDERGRGLELVDGLIELHGGERGVIDDDAGPGKTVYVKLSLPPAREDRADPAPSATPAGCSPTAPSSGLLPLVTARYHRCHRAGHRAGRQSIASTAFRSAAVPAPAPPSAVIRSLTCQSLAASSRARAARRAGSAGSAAA